MAQDTLITDPALLSVLQAAAHARHQSLAILDLLEEYHTRDQSASSADEGVLERQLALSKQQKVLNAHLARLRGLNRQAILGVRTTKQETGEARQEIDSLHLQLQNLYYEQRHLRGEITGCEDYDHRINHLPMVPVEDFLAAHPAHQHSSEHDLTIARIQDEHRARQALEEQRQRLVKKKEALVKETTGKKEELAKLDGDMEKWLGGQETVRRVFEAREKKMVAQAST
ncbi:hypothetical protein LTR36_002250 [Oleoguttula mirabilis]|uniref:THO complex subunit 5 n=1 Tax=Oleoguttula mirabilis TaxID=1507867 RepID=A0AAV9JNJ6_9PEZI|nr:hypothetical protein LTR36_002250 [Oleoguttula mirabilis]